MTEIEISLFRDKYDRMGVRHWMPWEVLVAMLGSPYVASCSVASCARRACPSKEGRAWSPAVYPPGASRQGSLVEEVSLLVVDLDHLTDKQLQAAVNRLALYQRILHASHSDHPDDCGVHAIVSISRPVTRDEWPRFWCAAMAHLKQPADPTSDAGRLYYLPSRPKDAESYYFEAHKGAALDVDAILALASVPPEVLLSGDSP